ncbi:hypothetical protein FRC06_010437, partial [Ceratobasidium sp. 370]
AGMFGPFRQVGGVSVDAGFRPGLVVQSVRKEGEGDEGVGIAVVIRSWRPLCTTFRMRTLPYCDDEKMELAGHQANISRRDDLEEATGECMTDAGGARAARDE